MKFSVLLSVYRKEQPAYLRQSLDSIFTQTLLPDEVVLVKDGPLTDALDEVAEDYCRKYPVIRVVPLSENQGLGRALNEGLKHCSYDLVARMDTDDVAKPERFEKQIAVFCAHPEMDVVGAWIDEFVIFKRTATVFRLYDRQLSCENFGKEIARKALEDIEVCPVALSGKPSGYYV